MLGRGVRQRWTGTIVRQTTLATRPHQRVQASQMTVYTLTVYEAGSLLAVETATFNSSAATMAAIPDLLAKHPGCECVKVHAGGVHIFSVDCTGATLDD